MNYLKSLLMWAIAGLYLSHDRDTDAASLIVIVFWISYGIEQTLLFIKLILEKIEKDNALKKVASLEPETPRLHKSRNELTVHAKPLLDYLFYHWWSTFDGLEFFLDADEQRYKIIHIYKNSATPYALIEEISKDKSNTGVGVSNGD